MGDRDKFKSHDLDMICMYACPSTDFSPQPFIPTDWTGSPTITPEKKGPAEYEVSGDTIIFHGIDTPEKRMKLIEAYEKLKEL